MRLPSAIATTATERAARRRRSGLALRAGIAAAATLFAVFLLAPVPRTCVDLFGAPTTGVARFGGLRALWLRREPRADIDRMQLRLSDRDFAATLREHGPLVTVEIPHEPAEDLPRLRRALDGRGAVEIRRLAPDGAPDGRVIYVQAQIQEAAVTDQLADSPRVAFLLWAPDHEWRTRTTTPAAIVVDGEARWTVKLHWLFGDLIMIETDSTDLVDLAETLDGSALHGGTVLHAAYVAPVDRALFVWAARATIAATGGAATALIASLLLRGAARRRRRRQ